MMKKITLFCTALLLGCNTLNAQIPNAGFETWTTAGSYDVPTGWDNLDSLTNAFGVYTCTKATPGYVGSYYIKLVSKTITGIGVAPGVAVSGKIDMATYAPASGFAYTARPVSLTGNWQYMGFGGEAGYIAVILTKWNTAMAMRDTIATTKHNLVDMVMSWATFSIPLTYLSGSFPDSAIIVLSASGATPVNNSYLYVDNLNFTGTVPSGVVTIKNQNSNVSISPNPTSGVATITYNTKTANNINVSVVDIFGKNVASFSKPTNAGANKFEINLSGFAKGIYSVRIQDENGIQVNKLVVE